MYGHISIVSDIDYEEKWIHETIKSTIGQRVYTLLVCLVSIMISRGIETRLVPWKQSLGEEPSTPQSRGRTPMLACP